MKEFIESIGDAKFIEDLAYMMSKVKEQIEAFWIRSLAPKEAK